MRLTALLVVLSAIVTNAQVERLAITYFNGTEVLNGTLYSSSILNSGAGVLLFPDNDGPGSFEDDAAVMYAQLGYKVFVPSFYICGPPGAPPNACDPSASFVAQSKFTSNPSLFLERALAAYNFLRLNANKTATANFAVSGKISVVGYDFGGQAALILGQNTQLAGAVSFYSNSLDFNQVIGADVLVGGDGTWTFKAYSNLTLTTGTPVVFKYNTAHDVRIFESAAKYAACDFTGSNVIGTQALGGGEGTALPNLLRYTFSKPGTYYVGCSINAGGHCRAGQRFTVTVTAKATTPLLVLNGNDDAIVPPASRFAFLANMQGMQLPTEFTEYSKTARGFSNWNVTATYKADTAAATLESALTFIANQNFGSTNYGPLGPWYPLWPKMAASASVVSGWTTYSVGTKTMKGYFAYDKAFGTSNLPLIVIVPDWDGINEEELANAPRYASMGYYVFVADIHGVGTDFSTTGKKGALAGALLADRTALKANVAAAVATARLSGLTSTSDPVLAGYCLGGNAVLEVARGGFAASGFIAFHPGAMLKAGSAGPATVAPTGPIAVFNGADDPNSPPAVRQMFKDEMTAVGATWTMTDYPDTVHAFTNYWQGSDPSSPVRYNANADMRSWLAMQYFLKVNFAPASKTNGDVVVGGSSFWSPNAAAFATALGVPQFTDLVFNFNSSYNVVLLRNKAAFDACNLVGATELASATSLGYPNFNPVDRSNYPNRLVYHAASAATLYFTSTVSASHCAQGMKQAITVSKPEGVCPVGIIANDRSKVADKLTLKVAGPWPLQTVNFVNGRAEVLQNPVLAGPFSAEISVYNAFGYLLTTNTYTGDNYASAGAPSSLKVSAMDTTKRCDSTHSGRIAVTLVLGQTSPANNQFPLDFKTPQAVFWDYAQL